MAEKRDPPTFPKDFDQTSRSTDLHFWDKKITLSRPKLEGFRMNELRKTDWFPKQYCFTRKLMRPKILLMLQTPKFRYQVKILGFGAKALKICLFSSKTCSISWVACSVNSECEILKMNFSRLPLHQHFSAASNLLKIKGFGAPAPTELCCIFSKNELFKMWLKQYCFKEMVRINRLLGDFDTILIRFC